MSSMVPLAIKSLLVTIGLSGAVAALDQLSPSQRGYYAQQMASVQPRPAPAGLPADRLGDALVEWKRLQQSDSLGFDAYARFLIDRRGWPGQDGLRRAAERAIQPGLTSPALIVTLFDIHKPTTATGQLRYAEALQTVQRRDEAMEQARLAWRRTGLSTTDEARLQSAFGAQLTPADHDARMDALLWAGQTSGATRQLALTSGFRRALFDARLAYRLKAPGAEAKGAALAAQGAGDAGYLVDRANYLASIGRLAEARATLANRGRLTTPAGQPGAFMEALYSHARNAANDRQWFVAYNIARQVDDIYAPGVDIATLSYGERDDFTNLTWLAGTTALFELGRPADAIGLFQRYARGSRTPQVQTRGHYWAGRAAEAAGQASVAQGFYLQAMSYPDSFYGQLAHERTGRALAPLALAALPGAAAEQAYRARDLVRATEMLGQLGARAEQTLFLRQIAAEATSDQDHALGMALSRRIGRPDLAVMLGRSARLNGHVTHVAAGFPSVAVPPAYAADWVMIHAIARQESQFDRAAISRVGARGLMQLMPGTAREQAGKTGLTYSLDNLLTDPSYNIMLGSGYFRRMLAYYGGSYPLAIAAYNAGPGNVNKWLRANGDPRTGSVDWLRWMEAIPIGETRNYVQRVLENAVVYEVLHPDRPNRSAAAPAPLSRYIGKSQPG